MARAGDVIENPATGERVRFEETATESGGARLRFEMVFAAQGFVAQEHLHPSQEERHEVISGTLGYEAYSGPDVERLPVRRDGGAPAGAGYVFVDEWDVEAPIEAVFDAVADARTYPAWWRPVYIDVESDGPPAVGAVTRQHFKGRLPYHLRTTSTVVRMQRPTSIEGTVQGDLSGRGVWTLSERGATTHVCFDWRVNANRPLLRVLTPLLRPLFAWNHNWAIARAIEGLEPYARRQAAADDRALAGVNGRAHPPSASPRCGRR
jgi:hypothetical protein